MILTRNWKKYFPESKYDILLLNTNSSVSQVCFIKPN